MATASVVIVGNEILTGKFPDENGPFFVRRLRELGVDLLRLSVVPDQLDAIADEVARCSSSHDHVFTTGGVGPTHDDVTFEGIARAFGVGLRVHPDLVEILERFGMADDANLRMATVPHGAELVASELTRYPVVRVRNVWVLPGVPSLARKKFEVIAPMLAGTVVRCLRVYARDWESDVAGALAAIQGAHPAVDVGSYPRFEADDHKLIVTLESRDAAALDAARRVLLPRLDVVRVEEG